MAGHNELGINGEDLAVAFLQKKNYQILKRNYRFQKAEVDIIAQKENTIVAIEVKTRSSSEFGDPQDFVKPKQIQSLVKAMNHYVESQNLDVEVRFDIIAILKKDSETRIEHIEDAFLYL